MSICSKEKLFRQQPEARGALCGLPARPAQLFWRRRGFHELAAGEGGQERFLPSKFSVLGLNDCLLWALNGMPTRVVPLLTRFLAEPKRAVVPNVGSRLYTS